MAIGRQHPGKRRILIGAGLLILLLAVIGVVTTASVWSDPLAPSLEWPTATLGPPLPTSATSKPGQTHLNEPLPPAAMPTAAANRPVCGGPPSMIILALGSDTREQDYTQAYDEGRADVIRIARIDFLDPKLTVISFPRDAWVYIPEIVAARGGLTHEKLNAAFRFGHPQTGFYNGAGGGVQLLARTIEENFGIRADHYVVVSMQVFIDMVDAIGGIDLYLEQDVDGSPRLGGSDFGYYPAGWNHLDGEMALKFSRIRKVDSDFERSNRQSQVLCAFQEKLISPDSIARLPELVSAFIGQVNTDLSPALIAQLSCLALKLDGERIFLASMPANLFSPSKSPGGQSILLPDFKRIEGYVEAFLEGTWPNDESGGDGSSCR